MPGTRTIVSPTTLLLFDGVTEKVRSVFIVRIIRSAFQIHLMHNSSEGELKSCVRKHIQIVGRGNINALLKGTCLVHGGEGSRVGESPVQHCHVEGDRCVSCC